QCVSSRGGVDSVEDGGGRANHRCAAGFKDSNPGLRARLLEKTAVGETLRGSLRKIQAAQQCSEARIGANRIKRGATLIVCTLPAPSEAARSSQRNASSLSLRAAKPR